MDTELNVTPGITPSPHRLRPRRQLLLGGLLVKEGLINRFQLEKALTLQEGLERHQLLGRILVDQKLITPHELNLVLGKYHKECRLGDVLVETRVIIPDQLEIALAHHRETDRRLGEVLMQLGFITERQLKQALCIQLRIIFVDLDDWVIDPSLSSLISERYARHHRVMPIAKIDDRITLAMDDPTDLEVVAELRSSTGCRVDVVAVIHAAMERAFSRLYGERQGTAQERRDRELPAAHERLPGEDGAAAARVEPTMPGAAAHERDVSPNAREELGARDRKGEEPARPAPFGALRVGTDAVQQLARTWEGLIGTVEALLHERVEQRATFERLERELQESRSTHERVHRELEAKVQALTRLEIAYAALLEEKEAFGRALGELRERYEALRRDRQFTVDRLDAVVRRFKS